MIKRLLDKTFWKFILVGMINTFVGTVVMFLFYNFLGLSYWVSSAANYIVGSIVSYFLNKNFTFENTNKNWNIIIRFIANIMVCYMISYGVANPFVSLILKNASRTIQENSAMFVGMCLFVMLNYWGQRFFVFREDRVKRP